MNAEKLYRYIYNLLPFPKIAPPSSTLKQNKVLTQLLVYVEVIFIDFYFLIFVA